MISAINPDMSFGQKCSLRLPADKKLNSIFDLVSGPNKLDLKFVRTSTLKKRPLKENEFSFVIKKMINKNMAKYIFEDGNKNGGWKLEALLKSIFNPDRIETIS